MLTPPLLRSFFDQALSFADYIKSGSESQQSNWVNADKRVSLRPEQAALLASFTRQMPVLVISGMWCGDCAQQVPIFRHFADASKSIDLRIIDRDKGIELSEMVKICGGNRVPTVIFMNEEFDLIGLYGDNSLSRMRAKAAKQLGATCVLPGAVVPVDEMAAGVSDWLDEFERAQLICRLSTKLRAKHQD